MTENTQALLQLLQEIGELSEHASLTGSMGGGEKRAAARYNSVLEHLEDEGSVPDDLFQPLPEGVGFGEIAIEARMLARFLQSKEEAKPKAKGKGLKHNPDILVRLAPFVRRSDLAEMVREQIRHGAAFPSDIVIQIAPFMDREGLGELVRDQIQHGTSFDLEILTHLAPFLDQNILGDLVRESFHAAVGEGEEDESEEIEATEEPMPDPSPTIRLDFTPPVPEPPIPPTPAAPPVQIAAGQGWINLNDLLDQLARPELSQEERNALLDQVRRRTV